MVAALQRLGAMLHDKTGVVRAELRAGHRDRAEGLITVEQGSAAGILGHHLNSC
jgi:hypothetical protein